MKKPKMVKKKYMDTVDMKGVEKRYEPCKHYVYILNVTWSDGTTFPVYRKFSDFYGLQMDLLDTFPREAGVGGDRILPFLPGVKLFGRSEVKKVADERKDHLAQYCRTLIGLPDKVSQDNLVIEFFEPRQSDINPPKDASKRKDSSGLISSLSLIIPKILQKNKPFKSTSSSESSPTLPDDLYVSGPVNFDTFYVIAEYRANAKGEISLTEGQEVEVIEKNENGWWLVASGSDQGWAPASFLEPHSVDDQDNPEPLYLGETFVTLAAYTAELDDEISFPKGVIVEAMHKLLDGWWIISYNGDVGHAPATYLAECNNPHVDIVPTKFKKPRQPTQRRCTIKTSSAPKSGAKRDMTLYRQLSAKNSRRRRELPATPTESNQPTKKKSLEDDVFSSEDMYMNDEELQNCKESYLLEKPCPGGNRASSEGEEQEYEVSPTRGDFDEDLMYLNVDTPSSQTMPRSSKGLDKRPLPVPRSDTLPPKITPSDMSVYEEPVSRMNSTNQKCPVGKPNQKVATPLAFLTGNRMNKAPKKPVKKSTANGNLAAPLKVPNRTDRSPSPRGGPKPKPVQKPKELKAVSASQQAGAEAKGLMAQRIAMFEN